MGVLGGTPSTDQSSRLLPEYVLITIKSSKLTLLQYSGCITNAGVGTLVGTDVQMDPTLCSLMASGYGYTKFAIQSGSKCYVVSNPAVVSAVPDMNCGVPCPNNRLGTGRCGSSDPSFYAYYTV